MRWRAQYDVLVPHHPGYGRSRAAATGCAACATSPSIYRWLLADLGVENAGAGRPRLRRLDRRRDGDAWRRRDLSQLVLVGAMGMKPPQGDILDSPIIGYIDYARAGFHDQAAFDKVYGAEPSTDQLEMWDICREMSFRIAWKPYMYSQTLPHLLGGVRAPALVVWGDDDKVVPRSAGERLCRGAAQGAARDRQGLRPLRRHGAARGARQARHQLHRRIGQSQSGSRTPCI